MKSLCFFAVLAMSAVAVCQNSFANPQLMLKIAAEKDSFTVAEKVNASFELKNVSAEVLCFPPPDQQCTNSSTGFLLLEGQRSDLDDQDKFYCHAHGQGTPSDKLKDEIRNHWIKLQPGAVYRVKAEEPNKLVLTSAGPWRLEARYQTPVAVYNKDALRFERAMAKEVGCTLPDITAIAEPILITVSKK
jgi:hypothetical protein